MFTQSIIEIPEYDYRRLLVSSYREIYDYVLSKANNSAYPACGYGFYSPRILRKDNKSYVSWEHFDTCD